MTSSANAVLALVERTATCDILGCDVTPIAWPHTTGWRMCLGTATAQVVGTAARLSTETSACEARDGTALVMPAGVRHRSDVTSRRRGISRWSHIVFSCLGGIDPVSLVDVPLVITDRARAARIGDANEELARSDRRAGLARVFARASAALRLLTLLLDGHEQSVRGRELIAGADRLAPVLARIAADPIGAQRVDLARLAGLRASRFHEVFRAATGTTPMGFALRHRLRLAQRLMLIERLPVAEAAARTGFDDAFYFSRVFKRHCGLSPRAWRDAPSSGGGI